jgi:hypothetical protein
MVHRIGRHLANRIISARKPRLRPRSANGTPLFAAAYIHSPFFKLLSYIHSPFFKLLLSFEQRTKIDGVNERKWGLCGGDSNVFRLSFGGNWHEWFFLRPLHGRSRYFFDTGHIFDTGGLRRNRVNGLGLSVWA